MLYIDRLLQQMSRQHINGIIWSVLILAGIISSASATDVPKIMEVNDEYIVLRTTSGEVIPLKTTEDSDGDGIENALEVNGFTYDVINGLQAWNGDSSVTYYKTDPLRWSTDGDPYDDFTEASGNNMPASVPEPENHPLVAARPVVVIGMIEYTVTPNCDNTISSGDEKLKEYTNETSTTNETGDELSASAGWRIQTLKIFKSIKRSLL